MKGRVSVGLTRGRQSSTTPSRFNQKHISCGFKSVVSHSVFPNPCSPPAQSALPLRNLRRSRLRHSLRAPHPRSGPPPASSHAPAPGQKLCQLPKRLINRWRRNGLSVVCPCAAPSSVALTFFFLPHPPHHSFNRRVSAENDRARPRNTVTRQRHNAGRPRVSSTRVLNRPRRSGGLHLGVGQQARGRKRNRRDCSTRFYRTSRENDDGGGVMRHVYNDMSQ